MTAQKKSIHLGECNMYHTTIPNFHATKLIMLKIMKRTSKYILYPFDISVFGSTSLLFLILHPSCHRVFSGGQLVSTPILRRKS